MTCLGCDAFFNYNIIRYLMLSFKVKGLWKSVNVLVAVIINILSIHIIPSYYVYNTALLLFAYICLRCI